jgi:SAM-dependent methyltransferase
VLRDDHPQSVRASLRRVRDFWWSAVGELEHTVRTGESAFAHVHGVPFFRYLRQNPDIQRRFDAGMARVSDADDAAIAASYDFARFRRIVDVGGGRGGLLAQILIRAPDAKGVLFDQPQVIAAATRPDEAGVQDRIEKITGNFFDAVPDGADCYVIKGVLHDFDDAQCIRILSNCRAAMRSGGRVLIANQDPPASGAGPHPNLTMDLQMMILLSGRERVGAEWAEIFRQAGLRVGDTIEMRAGFTLIEGIPLTTA